MLKPRGLLARTYEQFQAHIAALAPTVQGWTTSGQTAGARRTTAAAGVNSMQGSPWQAVVRMAVAPPVRLVQHGLPSQAVFDAQVAAGRDIYYFIEDAGTADPVGLNRNGYLSEATGLVVAVGRVTDLLYWDGTQAMRMNPFAGTGPTPYPF